MSTSCTSVSTQTASDDQVVKFWDELSLVGLPDDIDVQALFEPTGKIHFSPCFLSISVGTVAMLTMNEVFQLFQLIFLCSSVCQVFNFAFLTFASVTWCFCAVHVPDRQS